MTLALEPRFLTVVEAEFTLSTVAVPAILQWVNTISLRDGGYLGSPVIYWDGVDMFTVLEDVRSLYVLMT